MAGKTARTQWSKEPDEEPDYSDWKITLALKKASDDPAARPLTRSSSSKPKTKKTPPSSLPVTFSVHRNILGPQSEYFSRIFKSNDNGFSEAHHQHSHIDFPSTISVESFSLIVKAFEVFLDYCYLENVDFSFKGTSPVPLLYFCDYFQMEEDFESKVEHYSDQHFYEMASEHKLHLLYEQVIEFRTAGLNVEQGQSLTAESCCDTYNLLSEGTPMAKIADLPLWLDIVSIIQDRTYKIYSEIGKKCSSRDWSMNIANFLENNDNVDSDSFEKLTNEKILPYVEANAALVLLKKEQKYATLDVHICDNDDEDEDNKEPESPALTDLQNRCVESLVEAKLELGRNIELRGRAMNVMILLPRVIGMYLNKTLKSYGEEKVMHEQQCQKLIQENAKRRKLEHDSTVQLKNVEQELKTEKEKYRLLLAERVNYGLYELTSAHRSAQQQMITYQCVQQRRYK